MAKSIDAVFDTTAQFVPIAEGTYPAHILSLQTKKVNTRAGEAMVVNMTYKVAEEVSEMKQAAYEMDGYNYKRDEKGNRIPVMNGDGQATVSCSHLKDRTFYDNGFFIFTDTSSASKNNRYFQLLEGLGIKCKDDKGIKKLVLIEEEDVLGKAVMIDVKRSQYVTKETRDLPVDQQVKRNTFKVNSVNLWKGGKDVNIEELEEDVPF